MKRVMLIACVVTIVGGLTGGTVTAQSSAPQKPAETEFIEVGPASFIDGIEVPFDVVQFIHMSYPAHAVVEAKRIEQDYRLTICNDSEAKVRTHVYFSDKWQLEKEEEVFANKQKSAPAPKPQPAVEGQNEEPQEVPAQRPRSSQSESGRPQQQAEETNEEEIELPDESEASNDRSGSNQEQN